MIEVNAMYLSWVGRKLQNCQWKNEVFFCGIHKLCVSESTRFWIVAFWIDSNEIHWFQKTLLLFVDIDSERFRTHWSTLNVPWIFIYERLSIEFLVLGTFSRSPIGQCEQRVDFNDSSECVCSRRVLNKNSSNRFIIQLCWRMAEVFVLDFTKTLK